jgi:hypothetical protein
MSTIVPRSTLKVPPSQDTLMSVVTIRGLAAIPAS